MPEPEILARVPWFRTGGLIAAVMVLGISEMLFREPWSWGTLFWIIAILALAYGALAGLFNHSRILLREGRLEVRSFPLPWKVVSLPVADVTGLVVQGEPNSEGASTTVTWELRALLRAGPPLKLCTGPKGGTDFQGADAIRRTLCARLGLPPVPG